MLCVILAVFVTQQAPPAPPPNLAPAASEYLAEWAKAERKMKGMTQEHQREFRRTQHAFLVRKLGQKYGVTEADLRRAVREEESRRAKAAPPQVRLRGGGDRGKTRPVELETVSQARSRTRVMDAVPGAVGTFDANSFLAADYLTGQDAAVLFRAADSEGLARMVVGKRATLAAAGQKARVIEVHDFRAIDKGLFVRVRLVGGPNNGREAWGFPEQLDFGTPVEPATSDRTRR